ncbi:MAG: carboxypeptidase regulatory-like domain-containing protein [Acidobacteria bacterium]|nr:carboxypeptidase regulatory-like domain-containing protein [Acidobacteriota bacterium]
MTKRFVYTVLSLCLVLSVNSLAAAQSVNSTIGGTVQDTSGAFIPGVTITATNTATGIASTGISNESGVYQFASLPPGTYNITAELPGFNTQQVRDYQLGSTLQARINSIGTVLAEYKIRDLPVQSRNIFDLVRTTPGVMSQGTQTGIMAGGRLSDVNATRDGVNVNDGRYENGAWSVVYSSPDMVEEVKIVVAPVDAETSRGSGQVSMVTRSGGNQLRGSVFWANHNSALDANSWFNNFNGVGKSYDNRNQFGGRMGGPIVKNKTFFFALFEGQRDLKRNEATGVTLTDMARQGIFRYFPGADNANASNANPTVDRNGNPVRPARATGDLAAIDLFGNCTFRGQPVPNCRPFRDPLRPAISTHPYMLETFKRMPSPNEFTSNPGQTTDGLNAATIRFTRRQEGLDETNGNGDEVNRDQYNARIDHNFNSKHKISLIGTHEKTWGSATQSGLRTWPQAFDGLAVKRPYLYTIQFTSTLTNSLLNQVRASKRASNNWQWGSADRGDAVGEEVRKLLAKASGIPYHVITTNTLWNGSDVISLGGFGRWREGINPMRSIADDLSWTTGKHAFKMGVEWRRQQSNGFNAPNYDPRATLGSPSNLAAAGLDGTAFTGLTANAATLARNLLYNLSGSIASVNQAFGVVSSKDTTLVGTPILRNQRGWNYQSEMMAFFKDDWKFSRSLTLNLGIHWEYYGQPYEHDGLAARVVGGEEAFYNVKCTGNPGNLNFRSTCTDLVQVQFVGKNSPNPGIGTNLRGNDLNNFAPSVGFSWSLPWFGRDKTVIRAGYGMNFEGALRNFITVQSTINTVPGINLVSGGSGRTWTPSTYTSLSNLTLPIPAAAGTPTTSPFPVPTTERTLGISTYDRVDPYTQNWNFEIQREIARNTTVEARYIGSKGTKRWDNIDLNQIDGLGRNRALFDAFVAVRNGGESALLNQMLMNHQFAGQQRINGTTWTAAMALRTLTATRGDLANGEAGTFINRFNTNLIGGDQGEVLRRSGFPENYLVPSPQYSTVNISGNNTNSKYHALQLQLTRRLTSGFTNTTSFMWAKAMAPGNTIDPNRRWSEQALQGSDRKYQLVSNGTWELPFGTGHFLLGNAPGWVQQIAAKWQLGGIMNLTTGAPISFTTGLETISTENAKPNVVGAIPKDMGKVTKIANGVVYFDGYTQIADPSFTPTTLNGMNVGYNNKAIVAPNGELILVNPQPGQLGTLGYTTHRGPGDVRFDLNVVKRFQIDEAGKTFEFRLDAINVLNKPNWGNPSVDINSNNNFGRITTATGARRFVVNARVSF